MDTNDAEEQKRRWLEGLPVGADDDDQGEDDDPLAWLNEKPLAMDKPVG